MDGKTLGFTPEFIKGVAEYLALGVALPALIYWLIYIPVSFALSGTFASWPSRRCTIQCAYVI